MVQSAMLCVFHLEFFILVLLRAAKLLCFKFREGGTKPFSIFGLFVDFRLSFRHFSTNFDKRCRKFEVKFT